VATNKRTTGEPDENRKEEDISEGPGESPGEVNYEGTSQRHDPGKGRDKDRNQMHEGARPVGVHSIEGWIATVAIHPSIE
jgi:hypothetical protein